MNSVMMEKAARTRTGDFRALGAWYVVEFLNSYACTLLTAGCYDYAHKQLAASPSTELWLSAFWGFAYIFIALAAGRISERWGPSRSVLVMTAACVGTSLLGLFAIAVPTLWMLLTVMFLYNITSTTIWPAIESGITRTRGRMGLSARMALFNISWGSAGFAAFFTRGALEHLHWSTLFIVPSIASAVACGVFALFRVPAELIGREHVPDNARDVHELNAPGVQARAKTLLYMAWLGNALAYVAINVIIPLLAKLAALAGVGTLVDSGMLTSVWSLLRCVGFALAWIWVGWHYKTRWLVGAQAVLTVSFCVILVVHTPVVFILMQIIFGLAVAFVYSGALYYAMHVSSGHGGHAGTHEALIGLGVAAGPTIGALSGAGDINPGSAMTRIGLGVTALLLGGMLVMCWMAVRLNRAGPGTADG